MQNSNRALEQTVENKQLECDKLKEKTGYKSIHVWLGMVMIVKKLFSIVILLIMV
ncbi:MAG: hypothetical protein P4L59_00455 [Desulfosporosinus sp.]|nr:hypothetical protein [Desulfosporosinus sp.]